MSKASSSLVRDRASSSLYALNRIMITFPTVSSRLVPNPCFMYYVVVVEQFIERNVVDLDSGPSLSIVHVEKHVTELNQCIEKSLAFETEVGDHEFLLADFVYKRDSPFTPVVAFGIYF